ncbi:MAG TPA: WG repeat-containing protein [Candidatus Mediterraneibacter intestinipullorum]|nr:WG repeat-containing protein [Candidatus Mediterraneibacter intestinipullorum]
MKKYRALVPVVMIVLMAASWYLLTSDAVAMEKEYNTYLSEARKYAEDGITKYAIENYNLAIGLKSTPEIYAEVAQYYQSQGRDKEYLSWSKNFFETYPTEPEAYDCILGAYMDNKDYESCYDIIETADKRNISTDFISEVREEIMYVFTMDFNSYDNVGIYSNNYCAVSNDERWGYVDRYGKIRVADTYVQAGAFTQSGFAPVVNEEGDTYFIDKEGYRVLVPEEKYISLGIIADEKIAALRPDEKYTYLDTDLNVLFGEYDFASTANNGIAAVKESDAWKLIDSEGEEIADTAYTDIKLDEKGIAYRNDRVFAARSEGEYVMLDGKGQQVGSMTFEDARVFAGDGPAAVKIEGQWSFIGKDGKLISDKKYDDARSFMNGLAAVCIDGKWGFVDTDENIVIEPQFSGAKDFNEKGSCFVGVGNKWQLLKLYRLNREE